MFNIGLTGIEHHLVVVETAEPYSLATESSVADGIAQELIDEQQHGVAENPPSTDMFPMLDDGDPGTAEWFLEQLAGEPDPRTVFITTARNWGGLTQVHQDAFVRIARGEGVGMGMIVILNDPEGVPVIEHAVRAVEVDYA
ncbi:hypothetical protein [Curtobacterium sp. MCSS17_005]|uniref:hypothetical protein n=1 Tax=Curtobacterium sp. MCSS17_005 TaxID=2175641 RepID=UPI000DA7E50F|nr:hypothetical protein [Curtobacterium sp. MCSS17_005]WIB34408.1 hypothetical protein DEJ20_08055 [Curtobacterium sp. MCSS17_005]